MIYYKFLRLEPIYYFCEIDYVFKTEQWKPIEECSGLYEISDLGRIKSIEKIVRNGRGYKTLKELILKQGTSGAGYKQNTLHVNRKTKTFNIHKLVAVAFLNHVPNGHELVINHIDFNKENNKSNNLEIVTPRQNTNKKHLKSSSKYTGVHWNKSKNKWESSIRINNKARHLGTFINEIDAHNAYQKALKEIV